MRKPLEGVRVIDFSTFVAAPVCCRLLADLGAEVIKVERPEGDGWRLTGVSYNYARFSDKENPVFDIYNSGKRHVALNLKAPEGLEAFHKLLETADVLVTNTRPKALKKLGLDYESVKDKYPRLVYGIVLGYGEEGPDKDMRAFDTSAFWARGGFLMDQAIAREGYEPTQAPFSMGDTVTGYLLMGEICAALFRREKTGTGDYVRSGLFHNSIFTMGTMAIISQPPFGTVFPRDRLAWSCPSGSYECADGEWVYISGYNAALNDVILQMIGREDLLADPNRYTKRAELYEIMRTAILEKPSTYWLPRAKEFDIPLIRMGHYADLANDPQAWANGYLEKVDFPSGNTDIMPRSPIEMDSVGELKTKVSPAIGSATDAVLQELGYDVETIQALRQKGAVR